MMKDGGNYENKAEVPNERKKKKKKKKERPR